MRGWGDGDKIRENGGVMGGGWVSDETDYARVIIF